MHCPLFERTLLLDVTDVSLPTSPVNLQKDHYSKKKRKMTPWHKAVSKENIFIAIAGAKATFTLNLPQSFAELSTIYEIQAESLFKRHFCSLSTRTSLFHTHTQSPIYNLFCIF